MVITKINNLHIHNSNSGCCWNRYPIKILYQEAKNAGFEDKDIYEPTKK